MEIDTETIMKIAKLSRIKISEQDTVGIKKDLILIVYFVKKLEEVNTEGIIEFSFGQTYKEDMRKDYIATDNTTDDILKNTKNKNQDFFPSQKSWSEKIEHN